MRPSRRDALRLGALSLLATALPAGAAADSTVGGRNPYDTPTFRALLETLIPGLETDPDGAPGAIEAGTLAFLWEMEQARVLDVPFAALRGFVRTALDTAARRRHGRAFHKLSADQRVGVVDRVSRLPGVYHVLRFARAPFYAGIGSDVGYRYVGFEGPRHGYTGWSFDQEVCAGHPGAVGGNLP